jgi:hypothetical protein
MIAVGSTALAVLAYMQIMRLSQRAMNAQIQVSMHAKQARLCRMRSQFYAKVAQDYDDGGTEEGREFVEYKRAVSAYEGKMALHHDLLSQKYRDAARYPWLRVAPDPPEPGKPLKPPFLDTY